MSKLPHLDFFESEQKAIDHAVCLNFKYRVAGLKFGVMDGPDDNWAVCEDATAQDMGMSFLDNLPDDYADLSYEHLDAIRNEQDPLPFWEKITGLFSVADGEILRFIISHKVPLDKIIRHELACRGYDQNSRWCGFDEARKIWLK
jgi:hypothetical protein